MVQGLRRLKSGSETAPPAKPATARNDDNLHPRLAPSFPRRHSFPYSSHPAAGTPPLHPPRKHHHGKATRSSNSSTGTATGEKRHHPHPRLLGPGRHGEKHATKRLSTRSPPHSPPRLQQLRRTPRRRRLPSTPEATPAARCSGSLHHHQLRRPTWTFSRYPKTTKPTP